MSKNLLLYNWYENPDDSLIKINKKAAGDIVNMIHFQFNSIKSFISSAKINNKSIYQLKKKQCIRLITLKKLLDTLNIGLDTFNDKIGAVGGSKYLFRTKFPIILNRVENAVLVAAFMSDGNNQREHPFYANVGFLGNKIIKSARKLVPNIPYEVRNGKVRFHPILGRALNKTGVPYGNKTIINPKIPEFIMNNKELSRLYLIQSFDDEGHPAAIKSRKIVLGRSVAVRNLPSSFVQNMKFSKKVNFNNLPSDIKKIVVESPPALLSGESSLLKDFGINNSMRCRGLTKYEETISADWVIEIFSKENIRAFNRRLGFSSPEKVEKMKKYLAS